MPPDITPTDAAQMIQDQGGEAQFVILDVRTPGEFADGHLANAINIDVNDGSFAFHVGKLERTKSYLVYCRSGARSARGLKIMQDLGFVHVVNMLGGILQWQGEERPVVR